MWCKLIYNCIWVDSITSTYVSKGSGYMAKSKKNSIRYTYKSKYPTTLDPNISDSEWRKQRTIELYSFLPQTTLEERYKYTDIRDEVIAINYGFFGYVASHVYLKGSSATYEDKFQSALIHFCEMWHKYKFAPKYRTDLAFSVFFKPRLSECIYRELGVVKYSTNRSLKIAAAEQLGIHYSKLRYEDLSKVDLPEDKMTAIKAIFNIGMEEDLDTASIFIGAEPDDSVYASNIYGDDYDDIKGLIMHEMVEKERMLDMNDLIEMSAIYDIPLRDLVDCQQEAEQTLYQNLEDSIVIRDSFKD